MRTLLIISVFIISQTIIAQTILPTTISVDTLFEVNNSPYLVSDNVTISADKTVQFQEGCTILFNTAKYFSVLGTLKLIGTETDSIYLKANIGVTYWGPISTSGTLIMDYNVLEKPKRIINANHGILKINNSNIKAVIGVAGDDAIAIHYADTVLIRNTILEGDPAGGKIDAIDADGIHYADISNNIIKNWPDDAIDIGSTSSNVNINNNIIFNADCGISIGENSTAYAERNIIYDNHIGIQSHNGAVATTDHNTLFRNKYCIEPCHGSQANTGGTINVTNTIFSRATDTDIYEQANSIVNISYSISDSDVLIGTNNLMASPKFVDTLNFDFNLAANSPCIDSGNPDYTGSFLGEATDIGALEYDSTLNTNIVNLHDKIKIYPNPFNDKINIITDNEGGMVCIYDMYGKLVKRVTSKNKHFIINLSNLGKGVYFIRTGNVTKKIVKI